MSGISYSAMDDCDFLEQEKQTRLKSGQAEWTRLRTEHADLTAKLKLVTDKITEVSRSVDLEEIGTPVCNCGGRADNIADALYAIIRELKEENNDEQ